MGLAVSWRPSEARSVITQLCFRRFSLFRAVGRRYLISFIVAAPRCRVTHYAHALKMGRFCRRRRFSARLRQRAQVAHRLFFMCFCSIWRRRSLIGKRSRYASLMLEFHAVSFARRPLLQRQGSAAGFTQLWGHEFQCRFQRRGDMLIVFTSVRQRFQ